MIYISRYTGNGLTEETAFYPIAGKQAELEGKQWLGVDLRPDSAVITGWCLLGTSASLTTIPTGVIFLASDMDDTLQAAARNALNNNLGLSVSNGMSFREVLRAVATTEATGKANGRWNPITPNLSGQIEVFLGNFVDRW